MFPLQKCPECQHKFYPKEAFMTAIPKHTCMKCYNVFSEINLKDMNFENSFLSWYGIECYHPWNKPQYQTFSITTGGVATGD
jgi:hypothetical protein